MTKLPFALLVVLVPLASWAQEIPLDSCRQLPVVKAAVGKRQVQFLLDTGSTATLLNLKSFSSPDAAEITMDSWSGRVDTSARQVVLHDLSIGEHELRNVTFLAVDLTPLERSCQTRVDGVLGADLIEKLGLTIDLKNHVAILDRNGRTPENRFNELVQQEANCEQAFNRSDEKMFEECLDPEVVLLTSHGEFHGRKAVMKHFKECCFGHDLPVLISLTPLSRRAIGSVIWMEYEISVTSRGQSTKTRGTALFQKKGKRWLMSNMNYPVGEPFN